MGMKTYEELKDMLCEELEQVVAKGTLSAGDLDVVHKLTDTIKNIEKIEMFDDGGYSGDDDITYRGMNRGGYSRTDGMSYRRGRDSRGRYTSMRGGRYSYAEGKDELKSKIEEMLEDDTLSGTQRNALQKAWEVIK